MVKERPAHIMYLRFLKPMPFSQVNPYPGVCPIDTHPTPDVSHVNFECRDIDHTFKAIQDAYSGSFLHLNHTATGIVSKSTLHP
jgi:hypothetical protein